MKQEKTRTTDREVEDGISERLAAVQSNILLEDWRGSVSTFSGFTGTRPEQEMIDASWDKIKVLLCPDKPAILTDKKHGLYFVPCELKEAPLVCNTLETALKNGEPTIGKMRSKSHVTTASLIVIDVDGLSEAAVMSGQVQMKADGLTFLAYTSHSQGREDKPGMRVRFVIPIDREVATENYSTAWNGVDQKYFAGKVGKSDSSGANMYQQQGTWCCHPDRTEQASSWLNIAGVANADVLIDAGRIVHQLSKPDPGEIKKPVTDAFIPLTDSTYPDADAEKVADACQQIGAFRDTRGAGQSEPDWHNSLGLVGHCTNGEAICHEWSRGYDGYSAIETNRKMIYRLRTGPTTCDQFRKTNPAGCNGCVQTCNSPIALGREPVDELATIQQTHALIKLDGKFFVVDGTSLNEFTEQGLAKKLELFNSQDGKLLLMRAVKAQFPQAEASDIANQFFLSPQTICFSGIEFNPNGTSENYLNLWVGLTIHPKYGQWKRIQAFLLDVICSGDQVAYSYLIKYIAHALQRPGEKPGVMIIMVGGQGIGKGTLGRILQKIWGATCIQINNIDSVTGSFNASLERALFVFLDEALFSGNRRASDMLKSLVTEPIIQINEKYQPSRQIRSYHRFVAATNAEHFKNTERDDRRDFTLRVSDARKGDFDYWNALNHELVNGGAEAMAHELLEMDLSTFNVRDKPNTGEFLEKKLMSLDLIPRWWQDRLNNGDDWLEFISTKYIIDEIHEFSGGKYYQKPSTQSIAKEMSRLCPSAKLGQKQEHLGRARGYHLPPLPQARTEFEKYIGSTVKWVDSVSDALEE